MANSYNVTAFKMLREEVEVGQEVTTLRYLPFFTSGAVGMHTAGSAPRTAEWVEDGVFLGQGYARR